MAAQGTITMMNVQNKPQLVSLSTKQGNQTGSDFSDVTWTMQDTIAATDQNFTAIVSLQSMVFFNTFQNITSGKNKLKILNVFEENSVLVTDLIEVIIPPGHYNVTTLLQFLNKDGTCNKKIGNYYYGLGVYQDSDYPPFTISTSDPLKLTVQPPTAGTTGVLGTMAAEHEYRGFYLLVDSETSSTMELLGFYDKNQSGSTTNTTPQTISGIAYNTVGFTVHHGGVGTNYSFSTPWIAPTTILTSPRTAVNCIYLAGPTAITISWEQVYANTRNSYDKLAKGDSIAIIPVSSAYGYKICYIPPEPFKILVPNFSVNTFRLVVRDANTGDQVDFQGAHWLATLKIEFCEIDNTYKSDTANEGIGRNVFPTLHHTVVDHNLPHSGTGGYTHIHSDHARKRRATGASAF